MAMMVVYADDGMFIGEISALQLGNAETPDRGIWLRYEIGALVERAAAHEALIPPLPKDVCSVCHISNGKHLPGCEILEAGRRLALRAKFREWLNGQDRAVVGCENCGNTDLVCAVCGAHNHVGA